MNLKTAALLLMALNWLYETVLHVVGYRSMYNPIPENVRDIYDAAEYARWREYHKVNHRFAMVAGTVNFLIGAGLIALNVYARAAGGVKGIYLPLLIVLGVSIAVDFVTGWVFSYIDTMVIEQKYGFNRTTMKTFALDRVKELIVITLIEVGLVSLFAWLHTTLGVWTLVLFAGILVAVLFLILFLYPVLSRLFNKFEALEEGELRERLTALLTRHGYTVKAIEVIKASERTTKSNAYFSGFGRMKTIVLYDNLIAAMTTDEIVAVFAHELGHGLNRDTVRINIVNVLMFVSIAAGLFACVSFPGLYSAFGFDGVNYGFAFLLLSMVILPFVSTLFSLVSMKISRAAEFRADRQAVQEGLGEALISALKKLAKENFANLAPSELLVILQDSHPPIDKRIEAIRTAEKHGVNV